MIGTIATATEIQNNFGKYLGMVMQGNEVIVTKNGKEVGRLIPRDAGRLRFEKRKGRRFAEKV